MAGTEKPMAQQRNPIVLGLSIGTPIALAVFAIAMMANRPGPAPSASSDPAPTPVPAQTVPAAQPTYYNPGALHRTAAVVPATQQSPIIAPTQSAAPVSQSAAPVETARSEQPAVHHQAAVPKAASTVSEECAAERKVNDALWPAVTPTALQMERDACGGLEPR